MEGITYKAGSDCGPAAGKTLTGGRPAELNGNKVVQFAEPIIQGRKMAIKYDCRPDLAALVAEYKAGAAAEEAERQARWAAERAAQDAIDAPLIAAMDAEAAALRATIPAGCIAVECRQTGDLDGDPIYRYEADGVEVGWSDGDPIYRYEADGVEVGWSDVVILGRPCAFRPGVLGAFAERCVAYITPAKLAAAKGRIAATDARKARESAEDAARPQSTVCPYCGTYCYGDCGGKPGDQTEDDREMRTAMYEANYGIND